MFENIEVRSLTKAGVVLVTYLFVVLVIYFALSVPINTIFDGFDAADFAMAEDEKDTYLPIIRNALTIFFAILLSIPIVWFFFWVFHREPAYQDANTRNWRY